MEEVNTEVLIWVVSVLKVQPTGFMEIVASVTRVSVQEKVQIMKFVPQMEIVCVMKIKVKCTVNVIDSVKNYSKKSKNVKKNITFYRV